MVNLLVFAFVGFLAAINLVAEERSGTLEISGALEADLKETSAQLVFNQRARTWMLQLRSRGLSE